MSENITTIKDPTVHIKPCDNLVKYLQENSQTLNDYSSELPDSLKCIIENKNKNTLLKSSDLEWLNRFLISQRAVEKTELLTGKELYDQLDSIIENNYEGFDFRDYIREKNKYNTYLHDLMNGCELVLPKNEEIKRNPILAERIERLKKEQEEREYKEMTKNVDTNKKHHPEDTVSYQMNMMNRHLIAVLQFLVSVGAGFAFGFLGLQLVLGELNFGVRLLLGIAFAVVIAIAEFYFLAKHLNEEEKQATDEKKPAKQKPVSRKVNTKGKLHKD